MSRKVTLTSKQLQECLEKVYEQDTTGNVNITPENPSSVKDNDAAKRVAINAMQQSGTEITKKVSDPSKEYNTSLAEGYTKKQIQEMRVHRMIFESEMYTKRQLRARK